MQGSPYGREQVGVPDTPLGLRPLTDGLCQCVSSSFGHSLSAGPAFGESCEDLRVQKLLQRSIIEDPRVDIGEGLWQSSRLFGESMGGHSNLDRSEVEGDVSFLIRFT